MGLRDAAVRGSRRRSRPWRAPPRCLWRSTAAGAWGTP